MRPAGAKTEAARFVGHDAALSVEPPAAQFALDDPEHIGSAKRGAAGPIVTFIDAQKQMVPVAHIT
jgi:hypothetical protein